jgi:uncharacterized protein YjiS (DUF1127 family)
MTFISPTDRNTRSCDLLHSTELTALFVEWRQRIRSCWKLETLNDCELWDLSLTRAEADNESDKPFW